MLFRSIIALILGQCNGKYAICIGSNLDIFVDHTDHSILFTRFAIDKSFHINKVIAQSFEFSAPFRH